MECFRPNCTKQARSLWGDDYLCPEHYREAVDAFNRAPGPIFTAGFADIADIEEDKRIEVIGRTVMEQKRTVAFITDADPGKAARYIRKLEERFPGIQIIDRFPGPVKGSVSVKVGPPAGTNKPKE